MEQQATHDRPGRRAWLILLIAPFIGTLWPAWFSFNAPTLGGIPFFYWYQFLWVIIGALLIGAVYYLAG